LTTTTAASRADIERFISLALATPSLLVDLSVVEEDYRAIEEGLPDSRIFYALKANPHPAIARTLYALGCGFEVSSVGELKLLLDLGVNGSRIISSNPVKFPEFIRQANAVGVQHLAFDSRAELDKIAELAPETELTIRLSVPNDASEWPLDKKYGVEIPEAVALLTEARDRGLRPRGLIFHVGSQCREAAGWVTALEKAKVLWDEAARAGIDLELLNVGGGVPIVYTQPDVPSPAAIGRAIVETRDRLFPSGTETWLEPGRGVVGRAGTMVCSVIGVADREDGRWVYLDAGIFHGLAEAMGGITYRFLSLADGPETPCTVAGPSCDSVDVVARQVMLPPVRVGDRIVIPGCGAYTTAYSSGFNGFTGPETLVVPCLADV
jgi:ornithine decarboxylase